MYLQASAAARRRELRDERARVLEWVNATLLPGGGAPVESLSRDLGSGVRLLELLAAVLPGRPPRPPHAEPRSQLQRLENVVVAFRAMRRAGVRLGAVQPADVAGRQDRAAMKVCAALQAFASGDGSDPGEFDDEDEDAAAAAAAAAEAGDDVDRELESLARPQSPLSVSTSRGWRQGGARNRSISGFDKEPAGSMMPASVVASAILLPGPDEAGAEPLSPIQLSPDPSPVASPRRHGSSPPGPSARAASPPHAAASPGDDAGAAPGPRAERGPSKVIGFAAPLAVDEEEDGAGGDQDDDAASFGSASDDDETMRRGTYRLPAASRARSASKDYYKQVEEEVFGDGTGPPPARPPVHRPAQQQPRRAPAGGRMDAERSAQRSRYDDMEKELFGDAAADDGGGAAGGRMDNERAAQRSRYEDMEKELFGDAAAADPDSDDGGGGGGGGRMDNERAAQRSRYEDMEKELFGDAAAGGDDAAAGSGETQDAPAAAADPQLGRMMRVVGGAEDLTDDAAHAAVLGRLSLSMMDEEPAAPPRAPEPQPEPRRHQNPAPVLAPGMEEKERRRSAAPRQAAKPAPRPAPKPAPRASRAPPLAGSRRPSMPAVQEESRTAAAEAPAPRPLSDAERLEAALAELKEARAKVAVLEDKVARRDRWLDRMRSELQGAPGDGAVGRCLALAQLGLADNEVGDRGAAALAAALPLRPALASLGLRRNRVGAAGAAALADALLGEAEPRPWPALDLAYNPLGDGGCSAVARLVARHPGLRAVSLQQADISDEGALELARALEAPACSVRDLNVSGNLVGARGVGALVAAAASASRTGASPSGGECSLHMSYLADLPAEGLAAASEALAAAPRRADVCVQALGVYLPPAGDRD